MINYELRWSDVAFGSKKPLRDLNAIFVQAPREVSVARLTQLIKDYLPKANLVIGAAEEEYIDGFNNQPQFKTLQISGDVRRLIDKVNSSKSPHKITVLHYQQSSLRYIYDKIIFQKVLLVNGSWQYSFHTRPEYYSLVAQEIPFEYISPFASEEEAIEYAAQFRSKEPKSGQALTELEMLDTATTSSYSSFANEFQTGVSLGKRRGEKYKLLKTGYNHVVPYETFAWHYGALRERFFSAPGDLDYYDTVHAEIGLIIEAQKKRLDLRGTTLFINLLPCPHCARALCMTDIEEIVYKLDHSDGYAVAMLEKAGKKVRRLIDVEKVLNEEG